MVLGIFKIIFQVFFTYKLILAMFSFREFWYNKSVIQLYKEEF